MFLNAMQLGTYDAEIDLGCVNDMKAIASTTFKRLEDLLDGALDDVRQMHAIAAREAKARSASSSSLKRLLGRRQLLRKVVKLAALQPLVQKGLVPAELDRVDLSGRPYAKIIEDWYLLDVMNAVIARLAKRKKADIELLQFINLF